MRCVDCGHTYTCERKMSCSTCDGQDLCCTRCRPGRLGSGDFSGKWYCRVCWAEWFNDEASAFLVTLHLKTADERSTVSCFNIAGEEILNVTGDLSQEGLEHIKLLLEEHISNLEPEKRLAKDSRTYYKCDFRDHYHEDTWSDMWDESS